MERPCEGSRPRSGPDRERGRASLPDSAAVPVTSSLLMQILRSLHEAAQHELTSRSVHTHGHATRAEIGTVPLRLYQPGLSARGAASGGRPTLPGWHQAEKRAVAGSCRQMRLLGTQSRKLLVMLLRPPCERELAPHPQEQAVRSLGLLLQSSPIAGRDVGGGRPWLEGLWWWRGSRDARERP